MSRTMNFFEPWVDELAFQQRLKDAIIANTQAVADDLLAFIAKEPLAMESLAKALLDRHAELLEFMTKKSAGIIVKAVFSAPQFNIEAIARALARFAKGMKGIATKKGVCLPDWIKEILRVAYNALWKRTESHNMGKHLHDCYIWAHDTYHILWLYQGINVPKDKLSDALRARERFDMLIEKMLSDPILTNQEVEKLMPYDLARPIHFGEDGPAKDTQWAREWLAAHGIWE